MKRFNFGSTLPLLDPIEDMEIEDKDLEVLTNEKQRILSELNSSDIKSVSEV